MSELKSVLWLGFVVPPVRSVGHTALRLARSARAAVADVSRTIELGAERRLVAPGRPRYWTDTAR